MTVSDLLPCCDSSQLSLILIKLCCNILLKINSQVLLVHFVPNSCSTVEVALAFRFYLSSYTSLNVVIKNSSVLVELTWCLSVRTHASINVILAY